MDEGEIATTWAQDVVADPRGSSPPGSARGRGGS